MEKIFTLKVDTSGIGFVDIDMPNKKANIIHLQFLEELSNLLDEIEENQQIKCLVLRSKKEGVFIAGADLHGFKIIFQDQKLAKKIITMGHTLFTRLGSLPFPTVALIQGACLGGGLELSMGCNYRVVTDHPKTSLGLPEVSLGLFPGWGGTQRAPRIVGLLQSLSLVLTGRPVDAKKAFKIGLADAILPWQFQEEKLRDFIDKLLQGKLKKRKLPWFDYTVIGPLFAFWKAKKNILAKTKGFYKAPLAALKVMRKTFWMPLKKGLAYEAKTFVNSISTDLSQANDLIQVFFNNEALKKDPGLTHPATSQSVDQLGVIGAGTMGAGISYLASYRDLPVRFKDISFEMLGKGYGQAWKTYQTLIKLRKLKPHQASIKFHHMSGTINYEGFEKMPLVIEAATENLQLKHKIFHELEEVVSSQAVIASNTSSLTISELASQAKHPERFCGMHFFNPVPRMPLVEVVAGEKTDPEVVAAAVSFCQKMKKTPIVVKDCPGFLVNRVFVMGVVEIMSLLQEGVAHQHLSQALIKFGMPMDPFLLADQVGNDVNEKVLHSFSNAYPNRLSVPKIVTQIVEKGFLGKKIEKGFYLYSKGKKREFNKEVEELLPKEKKKLTNEKIVERVIFSMLNEASLALSEKVVKSPSHLDMALVLGTGFPPFRGGLLRYADNLGIESVVNKMEKLAESASSHFTPSALLKEMAKRGSKFYSSSR